MGGSTWRPDRREPDRAAVTDGARAAAVTSSTPEPPGGPEVTSVHTTQNGGPVVLGATHATATPRERAAMGRALELARRGPAHGPNPRVGCVLLTPDGGGGEGGGDGTDRTDRSDGAGTTLAEGWHAGVGTPHAGVAALQAARVAGADVRGSTAVVTLEPCNHTGRTGPCAQALLEAGVSRVVVAVEDPNPVAAGGAA